MALHAMFSTLETAWAPCRDLSVRTRARLYAPLLDLLRRLGVRANHISHLRLLLLVGFWLYLETDLLRSCLFVVVGLWLDSLDGPLARLLQTADARGRFVDAHTDHLFYCVVVLGAMWIDRIGELAGAVHIVLTLLLHTYATANAEGLAGPRVSLRTVAYLALLADAVAGTRWLAHVVWPLNGLLGLLAFVYYVGLSTAPPGRPAGTRRGAGT